MHFLNEDSSFPLAKKDEETFVLYSQLIRSNVRFSSFCALYREEEGRREEDEDEERWVREYEPHALDVFARIYLNTLVQL